MHHISIRLTLGFPVLLLVLGCNPLAPSETGDSSGTVLVDGRTIQGTSC